MAGVTPTAGPGLNSVPAPGKQTLDSAFVDLRDRYGITQLAFNNDVSVELCEQAKKLGREFVIQATGIVTERSSKNKNIPTGASTRRFKNSFVDLSKPPFNHSFTEKRELSKIEIKSVKGYLVGTYFCRKVGDSSGGSQLLGTKTSAKL